MQLETQLQHEKELTIKRDRVSTFIVLRVRLAHVTVRSLTMVRSTVTRLGYIVVWLYCDSEKSSAKLPLLDICERD